MNLAHVHLLLNHFPVIGFGVGLALFFVAVARKSDELKRDSLVVFFIIALLAIPTYLSGNAAQAELHGLPGVSDVLMTAHEDAALLAFSFMEITGFICFLGLWQFRRISHLATWNLITVLLLSVVTFGLMARAANIGGEIRHPEILAAQQTAAAEIAGSATARSIGLWVTSNVWVWPACETLHFVGLCLLFTTVLIVDLRMLGIGKRLSFAAVYRLLPLGLLGFGLNLVTGMAFFIATPEQYTKNVVFYWKIALVVLAGLNALYFMLFEGAWTVGPENDAPITAKVVAASAIFLWLGVLFCGHMLPFIGNSF